MFQAIPPHEISLREVVLPTLGVSQGSPASATGHWILTSNDQPHLHVKSSSAQKYHLRLSLAYDDRAFVPSYRLNQTTFPGLGRLQGCLPARPAVSPHKWREDAIFIALDLTCNGEVSPRRGPGTLKPAARRAATSAVVRSAKASRAVELNFVQTVQHPKMQLE